MAGILCRICTVHSVRLLAGLSKSHVLADSGVDYGAERAIVVTRFAVLGFRRALNCARQQSDEVDTVPGPSHPGTASRPRRDQSRAQLASQHLRSTTFIALCG